MTLIKSPSAPEPAVTPTVKRLCVLLLKAGPRGLSQAACGEVLFPATPATATKPAYPGPRNRQGCALAASKHTSQAREAGLVTRHADYAFKLTDKGREWAMIWGAP